MNKLITVVFVVLIIALAIAKVSGA